MVQFSELPLRETKNTMSGSCDCKRILVKAITQNNGDMVRQLFKTNPWLKKDLRLSEVTRKEQEAMLQVKSQRPLIDSAYIPDNAWCMAAVFGAHHVLQVMREFGVRLSETNSHKNNSLHCIIALASIETEGFEIESISTVSFIKSLATNREYTELLLAENGDGLRPLELASHLGTFSLFQFLFETSEHYVSRKKELSFFTVLYFDITDYIIGSRILKSPPFTMALLDQNNMNHTSLHDVYFTDPMKTWIAAIQFSNRPYIIVFAFLRITYIFNFLMSLHFTKTRILSSNPSKHSSIHQEISGNRSVPISTATNRDQGLENIVLLVSLMFSIIYSTGALLINTAYLIIVVCNNRNMSWKTKKVSGDKELVVYKWFYMSANWIILIGILVLSQDVMRLRYSDQNHKAFSANYIDGVVTIAVCVCTWDVMYYLQLIPGLNLYTIAVQRMLTDFISFGVIFGLFFLSYVFGFHVLFDDAKTFSVSLYRTFKIMYGIFNHADTNYTQHFLHVAFIFMVVYLLLNILIAIFSSSFEWVYKHRRIILTVQSLSVYLIMEPVMARLMSRFHNYLREKYLVFENDRVYVTKIVMKKLRYVNSNTISSTIRDTESTTNPSRELTAI